MERRRRLADLLAIPAGELLTNRLDHLPLARDHLKGFGDVFTDLGELGRAAARAHRRSRHNHSLARQMFGERFAHGVTAGVRRNKGRAGGFGVRLRWRPPCGEGWRVRT